MSQLPVAQLAALYREACRFDVIARKPGNVSLDHPAHGMTARDFLTSARVTAPIVAAATGVGAGVRAAVEASWAAVGCNTNLGILLLAVPLARAARRVDRVSLRERLALELAALDVLDARAAYAAIRRANPGGLGEVETGDVAEEPALTLGDAMALAADRDRIAWNYGHAFADVFELGLPALRAGLATADGLSAAVTGAFLRLLASVQDTHVARKFGPARAERLRQRAAEVASLYEACEDSGARGAVVDAFDRELKLAGVNPGTSADLVVASLFAMNLAAALEQAR
jgi:triphosphoribosyl-dephospho-CoA synthase